MKHNKRCSAITAPRKDITYCFYTKLQFESPVKQRLVVLTDITNEPDDQESMVRLLVYSNEYDIEGIIGTGSKYGPSRGDIAYFERLIDAYGRVRNNLQLHSGGYPTVAHLKSVELGVHHYHL